jgi:hypothetical protein
VAANSRINENRRRVIIPLGKLETEQDCEAFVVGCRFMATGGLARHGQFTCARDHGLT